MSSLVVQWWGLGAFTAGGPGSIPGQGTNILQVAQCNQVKKKKDMNLFWKELIKWSLFDDDFVYLENLRCCTIYH